MPKRDYFFWFFVEHKRVLETNHAINSIAQREHAAIPNLLPDKRRSRKKAPERGKRIAKKKKNTDWKEKNKRERKQRKVNYKRI